MNPVEEGAPAFRAPPLACDAHFHVFGPAARYPYASAEPLRYAPPEAPLTDYLALAAHLGIERYVFVQPSAYGRDNACMLDAMRAVGIARCRGIVDVDEEAPDALLAEMDALGVRGVRINYSPVKPHVPGFSREMLPRIRRIEARCRELGWHLDFLGPGWLTEELLPVMASLTVPFSVAHMGMFLAKDGPQQPGFQALIALLRRDDVRGYAKFTGTYRMASPPDFADAAPMARALVEAVPHRIIWGSDYPHLSFAHAVGSVQLFNLLGDWADATARARILTQNPAELFGF
jgi:predicted TIM-barrel fold metal-dependent hydrolase